MRGVTARGLFYTMTEKFDNAAFFLRLDLPSTPVRHENDQNTTEAIEKLTILKLINSSSSLSKGNHDRVWKLDVLGLNRLRNKG